jgi:hypothetical protein
MEQQVPPFPSEDPSDADSALVGTDNRYSGDITHVRTDIPGKIVPCSKVINGFGESRTAKIWAGTILLYWDDNQKNHPQDGHTKLQLQVRGSSQANESTTMGSDSFQFKQASWHRFRNHRYLSQDVLEQSKEHTDYATECKWNSLTSNLTIAKGISTKWLTVQGSTRKLHP